MGVRKGAQRTSKQIREGERHEFRAEMVGVETVGIVEFGFGGEREFCVHARNELGGGESSNPLVEQFDAVAGPGII